MKGSFFFNHQLVLFIGIPMLSVSDTMGSDPFTLSLEHTTNMEQWTPIKIVPQMLDGQGRMIWTGEFGSGFFRMNIEAWSPTPVPDGFALIPAGTFLMGDSKDGNANAPPVYVYVSEFYMATHELT